MDDNKKGIKIILWVLSITAFIQMRPYFVWMTYSNGKMSWLIKASLYVSALLITVFLIVSHRKINTTTMVTVTFLIVVQMYMLMIGIDNTSFLAVGNYIILIVMIGFFFITEHDRMEVFNKFANIFALSLVSGLIVFILTHLNFQPPYQILQTDHAGKISMGVYYQKYFGSVFLYSPYDTFIRLNAMYDEAGVVGTFSALFLIADDLRFKGRLRNIIILIGGILSFSMAFYVIIIIGLVIKSFNMGLFKFSIALIVILLVFQGLMTVKTDNVIIKDVFQKRFKVVNGAVVGDNRANESFNYAFNEFIHGDLSKVLTGYGANASENNPLMYGSYVYKMLIYDYGIIGFIMLLGWIIYASIRTVGFDKRCIVLLIAFLLSIYQRPYVLTIPYIFLLFGGYANLKNTGNENKKGQNKFEKTCK
ncbi:MAG TPA: hypothetical protein VIK86_01400 [Candidatus Paceibacterota bacterium]